VPYLSQHDNKSRLDGHNGIKEAEGISCVERFSSGLRELRHPSWHAPGGSLNTRSTRGRIGLFDAQVKECRNLHRQKPNIPSLSHHMGIMINDAKGCANQPVPRISRGGN
jgi:hypothetical protein